MIAYLLIGVAALAMVSGLAYRTYQAGADNVRTEWEADKAAARAREAELSAFAAKALADERAKRRTIIQERTVHVDREVDKPIYRDRCLPDTGLCLANAAISGRVSAECLEVK